MQSSASTEPTSSSVGVGGQGAASKLPDPPKELFARRYKFVWPLLLTVNLAVGGLCFSLSFSLLFFFVAKWWEIEIIKEN
ncbi:hypothetical protein Ancab_012434 [Ancistrocladus abbreviatus]